MEDDGAAEYQRALVDLNESFKMGIRAFAAWYATEWKISAEQWKRDYSEPPPGGKEWFAGYNAAVEAITGAVDSFLGDYHP